MLASGLASESAGILCHPVEGADRWQISRSSKCRSVISNSFESDGLPEEGNNLSHCSSNITRFRFSSSSFGRLLFNAFCKVDSGCMECKNFIKTFVPSSIISLPNLVPFVFSFDRSITEGPPRPAEVGDDVLPVAITYYQALKKQIPFEKDKNVSLSSDNHELRFSIDTTFLTSQQGNFPMSSRKYWMINNLRWFPRKIIVYSSWLVRLSSTCQPQAKYVIWASFWHFAFVRKRKLGNSDCEVISFDSALKEALTCLSEFNMSRALKIGNLCSILAANHFPLNYQH